MKVLDLPIIRLAFSDREKSERRIVVVNGHPDPRPERYCGAICDAYMDGVKTQDVKARYLAVGEVAPGPSGFLPNRGYGGVSDKVASAIDDLRWANWLVIVFPLWLNGPPPSLQAMFHAYGEQLKRIGMPQGTMTRPKDGHIIVTMSMPSILFGIGRSRSSGNPLSLCLKGVEPRRTTFIGGVEGLSDKARTQWLSDVRSVGRRGM